LDQFDQLDDAFAAVGDVTEVTAAMGVLPEGAQMVAGWPRLSLGHPAERDYFFSASRIFWKACCAAAAEPATSLPVMASTMG